MIKYGVILDGEFFDWLENNIDALLALDEKRWRTVSVAAVS